MVKRIVTGLFLIAIATTVILKGSLYLFSFLLLTSLLCCREVIMMLRKNNHAIYPSLIYSGVILMFLSLLYPPFNFLWNGIYIKIMVIGIILWSMYEIKLGRVLFFKSAWLSSFRVLLFFGPLFSLIYLTRGLDNGLFLLGFSIACIAASDIVALFGGKFIGKRPLSKISPNKTIEGSICGILGSMAIAIIFVSIEGLNFKLYLGLSVVIAIISQLGDLHESLTKRTFNVKDSSDLLPGHGGFYDRADSIIFVVPLIYFLFNV